MGRDSVSPSNTRIWQSGNGRNWKRWHRKWKIAPCDCANYLKRWDATSPGKTKLIVPSRARRRNLRRSERELGRYMARQGASAPALQRAAHADRYAELIQNLLKEALPSEVGEVSEQMTRAWKAMAHLSDRVDRIEITADCEVKMLNARGDDLHEVDKSAGASQVFTQALITAITKVNGRTFPFVVDTPLARLSRDQRIGVLKTFTDRSGQVILLSTDEEVVDDKLDAIRERLLAAFELKIRSDKGIAVTSVQRLDPEQI